MMLTNDNLYFLVFIVWMKRPRDDAHRRVSIRQIRPPDGFISCVNVELHLFDFIILTVWRATKPRAAAGQTHEHFLSFVVEGAPTSTCRSRIYTGGHTATDSRLRLQAQKLRKCSCVCPGVQPPNNLITRQICVIIPRRARKTAPSKVSQVLAAARSLHGRLLRCRQRGQTRLLGN